jgi:hypothetical protein
MPTTNSTKANHVEAMLASHRARLLVLRAELHDRWALQLTRQTIEDEIGLLEASIARLQSTAIR